MTNIVIFEMEIGIRRK